MIISFIKTPNGIVLRVVAEQGDSLEDVQNLRAVRHAQANESRMTEGMKDEITFFSPLKWPDEKNPVRTS